MQKNLLVALAALLIFQTFFNLAQYVRETQDTRFGGDFIVFWNVAHETAMGELDSIYRKNRIPLAETDVLFPYPPHFLPLIQPLGYLEYNQAVFVWSALPLLLFYVLLFHHYGFRRHEPKLRLVMAASVLPMLAANLMTGQSGTWLAVLFLAAVHYWRSALITGICLALMTVKPQFGLLWPVALIAARQWRTMSAAVAATLVLCAATAMWFGTAIWNEYLTAAQTFGSYMRGDFVRFAQLALSPFISLYAAGLSKSLAGAVQVVSTLAMVVIIFKAFRHSGGRFDLLACAALLATPYALVYDSPILALAILPLLLRAWEQGWKSGLELAAFVLILLMPYAQPLLIFYYVPFGMVSLLFLFVLVYRRTPNL